MPPGEEHSAAPEGGAQNVSVSERDKLWFYRDEVKHEFNLLAARSTILVTCQSFLVVPFAILNTAQNFRAVLVAEYLVAALGIFVAVILVAPIQAGHRALDAWLVKQRSLLRSARGLSELAIERDRISGAESQIMNDRDHVRSLAFSQYGPWAFVIFWVASIAFCTVRAYLGV